MFTITVLEDRTAPGMACCCDCCRMTGTDMDSIVGMEDSGDLPLPQA